jgi:hypothetical protein
MIKIRMYPAGNGDAFLITSDGGSQTTILVDGGYVSTFRDHILPDLEEINKNGRCLDLVVATHIDADHISGLLDFFTSNGHSRSPQIIPVRAIWHNSLRNLTLSAGKSGGLSPNDRDLLLEIGRQGYSVKPSQPVGGSEISARQGSSLAALLLGGDYNWNNGNGLTTIESTPQTPCAVSQAKITVIGPPEARLRELQEWWLADLRRLGFCGSVDKSAIFDDDPLFLMMPMNFSFLLVSSV